MTDLLIIGGGVAGLAAAIYAASEGLTVRVLESSQTFGGAIGTTSLLENFVGFPEGITGKAFAQRSARQARKFGAELVAGARVASLEVDADCKLVTTEDGATHKAKSVLVTTGLHFRNMDLLETFRNRGVYYGAVLSKSRTLKGKTVVIIGGANSAGQAALHLARYAERVILAVRGNSLEAGMSQYLVDHIRMTANIEVRCNTSVEDATGHTRLECITFNDGSRCYPAACFVFIGSAPDTDAFAVLQRDAQGYIVGDAQGRTAIPGVFVAGNVKTGSVQRALVAAGEGAAAVSSVHAYLATANN